MLKEELLEIDKGFWLDGEDFFLRHVDERCMLVFTQMQGIYSREEVAATAKEPKRWQDLRLTDARIIQPSEDVAMLSYEARVKRHDGTPYRALIGSLYVRKGGAWKLAAHQHSELEVESAA